MILPFAARNKEFEKHGRDDVAKWDTLCVSGGSLFLRFESSSSKWRQGVWLKSEKGLYINHQFCPSADIWMDSAPDIIECNLSGQDSVQLYNIWERDGIRSSLSFSSGMIIEEINNGKRYHCNDIGFKTAFDKLIFSITYSC